MKDTKTIFTIMPFKETISRDEDELTNFYKNNLKKPTEDCDKFKYSYSVSRSGTSFNMERAKGAWHRI